MVGFFAQICRNIGREVSVPSTVIRRILVLLEHEIYRELRATGKVRFLRIGVIYLKRLKGGRCRSLVTGKNVDWGPRNKVRFRAGSILKRTFEKPAIRNQAVDE